MKERGISLIEMVVVIAISSILLGIGTLRFNEYSKRYRTEAQTRKIHSELVKARANALFQRRETLVKLYPKSFEVYSSAEASGVAPIVRQALDYPIIMSRNGNNVVFDERGMCLNSRSICLESVAEAGAVDSVVISDIMIRFGKKDKGDVCNADNITIR
jgi:type IV fimbrial biogenesis protein FimT